MRLVHKATGQTAKVGDFVTIGGVPATIDFFREPHKAASEGSVSIRWVKGGKKTEYYTSVAGLEWVEREDRLSDRKLTAAELEFFSVAFAVSNLGHGADKWKPCLGGRRGMPANDGEFETKVANWQNTIVVDMRELRSSASSLRQYIDQLDQEASSEAGEDYEPCTIEIENMQQMLRDKSLREIGTQHNDYLPLLCWVNDHCTTQFNLRQAGNITIAEHQGLVWLAEREFWSEVEVLRRSDREFDLRIVGTRTTPATSDKEFNFSAWFVMACVREFWEMGKIPNKHDDWSFLRDREDDVQWADFNAVLAGKPPTGKTAEVGGIVTIKGGRKVPQSLVTHLFGRGR